MAHHNIYDVWTWTGGHADGEKDMLAVAIKEAKEETGLTEVKPITDELIAVDVLAVNSHYKNNCFIPAHLHINLSYALEADETQLLQAKADENSAVAWWSIEEALQFAKEKEPRIAEVYEKIIKRVKTIEEGKTFKEDDRS
jgi:ADP-ribose pyrophosphatase YjhB (NUDIX family)